MTYVYDKKKNGGKKKAKNMNTPATAKARRPVVKRRTLNQRSWFHR